MAFKFKTIESLEEFDREVGDGLVVIDFWAPWCRECREVAPIILSFSDAFYKEVDVFKVNTDECFRLARKFEIKRIPTLLVLYRKEVRGKLSGVYSEEKLIEVVESARPE